MYSGQEFYFSFSFSHSLFFFSFLFLLVVTYMVGVKCSKMSIQIICLACDAICLFHGIFWVPSAQKSVLLGSASSIQIAEKSSLYCCSMGSLWSSPSPVTSIFSPFPYFLAKRKIAMFRSRSPRKGYLKLASLPMAMIFLRD